jgi:hypothetical protein
LRLFGLPLLVVWVEELRLIRQASLNAGTAYRLVTAFMQILPEQVGQQLDRWLKELEEIHLPEFEPFVEGIQ